MSRRPERRVLAGLLAVAVAVTACTRGDERGLTPPTIESSTTLAGDPEVVVDGGTPDDDLGGPDVHLSDGRPAPIRRSGVPVVTGEPLTDDAIAAALDRLPEWVVPPDDQSGFERPAERLGPPLVGEQVETPFPPPPAPADPEPPAADELHVVRFQPEGEVDVAPFLSVTFDQPMVPLATLDQLAAEDVPVVVTPPVEGRWRWIGTRTLRFEVIPGATDRLPAATEYTVEVPAGTTSANGAVLGESVTWTFATPPPTVTQFVGTAEAMPTEPVFVAVFDQIVEPAAVLDTVSLSAGGQAIELRLAAAAEVEADEAARAAAGDARDGHAVAFVTAEPLPTDSAIDVAIGPGTPSAEGPRTSTQAAHYSGRTYGPLEVVEHMCSWDGNDCTPGSPLYVRFNNPLDTDELTRERVTQLVTVEPAIAAMRISVYGNEIEIAGATAARTTYEVTLGADLADVFGQRLGTERRVEFEVGPARPSLTGLDRQFVTTDPMADRPTVSVTTVNHTSVHVTAWAVTADELGEYREYGERFWSDTAPAAPQWPVVLDADLAIDAPADRPAETLIDLSDAFASSGSQLVVRVAPTQAVPTNSPDYWANRPRVAWVQQTTLGIDAFSDGSRLVIWTTDLTTGEPVGDVPVELLGDGRVATTDADGLAEIELGSTTVTGLFGTAGNTSALLAQDWAQGWVAQPTATEGRLFVFDDRGIYKPGETVRIAGWVRRLDRAADALLALFGDDDSAERTVTYTIRDAQGNELASASVPLNRLGGFNLAADLPVGANLGPASVELQVSGEGVPAEGVWYHHQFQIQEFRTPEFEVTARAETAPPYFQSEPATVAVDANYYAGGPLPDADVDWLIGTSRTNYAPPGWDRYHFGEFHPWWWIDDLATFDTASSSVAFSPECFDCPGGDVDYEQFSGRTDANGTHYLQIAFGPGGGDEDDADADDAQPADLPRAVTAEATVFDVNRQAWSSRVDLLVHAARYYVGLRSDRAFVEQGTPIRIDAIVTDVDGAAVAGREVTVTAGRIEWTYTGGETSEQLVDEQTCELTSSAAAERCEFATDEGGQYRVTATVADDTGHRNRTEMTVWVSGGTSRPARDVEHEQVTIVPAADEFEPGDTAELLVQAPFAPATGVYTVVRGAIREAHTFEAPDGSAAITIPIDDADVPELTLEIEMVGTAPRLDDAGNPAPDAPDRPAFATGRITLPVPPVSRALTVTATPAAEAVEPGADTSVTVAVTGPDGQAVVGADVAVVVVDEAVLALTGYELADPLDVFYAPLGAAVQAVYGRSSIVLTRSDAVTGPPEATEAAGSDGDDAAPAAPGALPTDASLGGGAARSAAEQQAVPIELRENFDALAVFAPTEVTGADGTVTVAVPLPDSLTRYRVMAVAVDGATRFGKGESTITARLPLMARPSAPRFLNFGDRFELPVVLQNQTDDDMVVDVAVEVANLELTGPLGQRVTVPADDRVEVRFPAATVAAGTARYRVVAVSTDAALGHADAVAGELPVYTPATAEAFATYGVLDGTGDPAAPAGVSQPVVAPSGVFAQFGGLELTTSSTAVQALTDAVLYLAEYDYRSADAYASRIMAIATLRDVLSAFQAEGLPSADELDAAVAADLAGLSALQNDDGGWAWWQRGRPSEPWITVTVAHALVLAQQAGYPVDQTRLDRALGYLAAIEQFLPPDWPDSVKWTVRAYAIYVLGEADRGDPAQAAALYAEAGDALELDALAWLWPSVDDAATRAEIERTFLTRAVDTAGAVTFATDYGDDAYLIAHSDWRTDGIALDALITQAPASDLIPKVVAGLLGGQTRGRWNNAYENALILVALNRYFGTFEDVTPDFVARAWLGDEYVSEHAFQGRSTDRAHTLVPMQQLLDTAGAGGAAPLILQNDGVGRMYYRLGLRYAPESLVLDPRDEGFVVDRVYEPVDDPGDVTRDADGTWHIRAGALVRVRLTMVADAVRTHVALVDPLPAGLEAVNPELPVGQTVPPPESEVRPGWWWWDSWYEHQNLGDDRVEAFAAWLPGGTYEYTYVARATTPGEFVTPPARAEQIYAPEVFGRSGSTRVVVADPPA